MARVTPPLPKTVIWPPSAVGLQVPPAESAQFADAHPGSIEEREDRPVPGIRLQAQDAVQVGFGQDSLGEPVADRRQAEGAAHIERQVPGAVREGQERFDGRQGAVAAGGSEIAQRVGELLADRPG